jgi:hypothetical protein
LSRAGGFWLAGETYGRDAGGIRLDASDACLLGLANHLGRDGLVEVQRHEVVDIGLNGTQTVAVLDTLLHAGDGWDEVWLARSSQCEFFQTKVTVNLGIYKKSAGKTVVHIHRVSQVDSAHLP